MAKRETFSCDQCGHHLIQNWSYRISRSMGHK